MGEVGERVSALLKLFMRDPSGERNRLEINSSDHIHVLERVVQDRPYLGVIQAFDDGGHEHYRRMVLYLPEVLYDLLLDCEQIPAPGTHIDVAPEAVELKIDRVQAGVAGFLAEIDALRELDAVRRDLDLGEAEVLGRLDDVQEPW